jgi:nucleoside-triphosphatase THEP1
LRNTKIVAIVCTADAYSGAEVKRKECWSEMIYIITGAVKSGKSTKLLQLFHQNKTGDGFYNRKIFSDSIYIGQEMVHLTTGSTCPFSYRLEHVPILWDEVFTYQDYSFSRAGLLFCRDVVNNSINNSEPFYIDEIGPLELQEKGLYQDFQKLIQTKKDIYVVIRNRCLSDVLAKFKIDRYTIL